MGNENQTKLCKHCKTEIPKSAKVCPNCRRKQGGKGKWIAIAVVVVLIIGVAAGGENDQTDQSDTSDSTVGNQTNVKTESENNVSSQQPEQSQEKEESIEYTSYTVSEMMSDLNGNAMNASEKYKDQYIEITGKLNVIDSSGKYISLVPSDEEYAIIGVQCFLKNDEQKDVVKTMSIGDDVTLRGKCTNVGEVMGYSLDIDSIE